MAGSTLHERYISVAGVRSVVLEGGGHGPEAAVFVHGNPGSSRDWRPFASAASEFARVLAVDMPGFGRADKPEGFDYTVAGYARHLAGVLDACEIRRAHLVLHDFGGPWGLKWAADHPDAFRSVVLIDAGVLRDYQWHLVAQIWMTPLAGEFFQAVATRELFYALVKSLNPKLPDAFIHGLYDDYDDDTRHAVLALYRATPHVDQVTESLAARLKPLNRPALVIWGELDPYLPAKYAERQDEAFDVQRVVVLPGGGHWPFAEAPQAVLDAMIPFLRARIGGGG